jgi:hypothetical protein
MPVESGKKVGNVEKVAVKNMAVPIPSITRRVKEAKMNAQDGGISIANL